MGVHKSCRPPGQDGIYRFGRSREFADPSIHGDAVAASVTAAGHRRRAPILFRGFSEKKTSPSPPSPSGATLVLAITRDARRASPCNYRRLRKPFSHASLRPAISSARTRVRGRQCGREGGCLRNRREIVNFRTVPVSPYQPPSVCSDNRA